MRCINCHSFTLLAFCDSCLKELSEQSWGVRKLENDFKVYYFYKYSEIKHLLHSKHKFYGYFVFKFLAKLTFAKFHQIFKPQTKLNAIALDDRAKKGLYSHAAILARALKSPFIKPVFAALHAQNKVSYSGKSLEFRRKNKRKFKLLKEIKYPVILVDDIITTGSSILEAKEILEKNKICVLFALVLADAKD
ncbi:ComF family protein [Campylobacter upsaliensis]|uniref:ComF family protein n=1 Tax=Campylobacter upsaliensis TaxID=28080 RepID=UPI00126E0648|nr:ComF family protein [Campylobacter upsaliensis]EAI5601854.1 ComF family protein [Campylobacter upsaliensis]EAJ7130398.1 ComF family protein [Campylobacter upsaliensis]EAK0459105.1 ComF family protein [Campylobacter upsaliensis]EAK6956458.1 ComF family protein [Campylobacter upsaliensis]EAL3930011.1 ComF family protein [Campylobacter upsaliensis]